jgi:hypothetical protein
VFTTGLFTRHVKLEGSVFNGRSPNEKRWDIDRISLDSYSGRLTVNPTTRLSFSAGYGYLKSPEGLHPEVSAHRVTFGAFYGGSIGNSGQWASAVIAGGNKESGDARFSTALLLESELVLDARNTFTMRAESIEKSAGDLVLPDTGPDAVAADRLFRVSSFSLGYIRDFARNMGGTFGVGVRGTINFVPTDLETFYGSANPLGALVFIRLRPAHDDRASINMR